MRYSTPAVSSYRDLLIALTDTKPKLTAPSPDWAPEVSSATPELNLSPHPALSLSMGENGTGQWLHTWILLELTLHKEHL